MNPRRITADFTRSARTENERQSWRMRRQAPAGVCPSRICTQSDRFFDVPSYIATPARFSFLISFLGTIPGGNFLTSSDKTPWYRFCARDRCPPPTRGLPPRPVPECRMSSSTPSPTTSRLSGRSARRGGAAPGVGHRIIVRVIWFRAHHLPPAASTSIADWVSAACRVRPSR